MIGNHRHRIVDLGDLTHAWNLEGRRLINEATLPPKTGDACTVAIFMSGTLTSMPYIAVPLTLPETSSRFADVPMIRNSLGSLSLTSAGTG